MQCRWVGIELTEWEWELVVRVGGCVDKGHPGHSKRTF